MPMTVYGAGGIAQLVKAFTVYGAGGVAQAVKNAWVYDAAGTPRKFFSGAGGFQLTAGNILGVSTGYQESPLTGVVVPSPPQLAGRTAILLVSSNSSNLIRLSLFSPTNPGQNLFNTLTIAPIWFGNTSGATYAYSGQTATWDFPTTSKMVVGQTYNVSVT